jgi:hypothetical protein
MVKNRINTLFYSFLNPVLSVFYPCFTYKKPESVNISLKDLASTRNPRDQRSGLN